MKKRWPFLTIGLIIGLLIGFMIGSWFGFQTSLELQSRFFSEVAEDRYNFEESKHIWFSENSSPEEFARAAHSIILELGQNGIWPTAGNIISILGQPTGSNLNGYQGDIAPRLNLLYKKNKVSLSFSITGPIESVGYFVNSRHRKGWGFPDDYPKSISSSEWPIESGTFANGETPKELNSLAIKLLESLKTEADWYPEIMKHYNDYEPPNTPDGLNIPCNARIMIMDGLLNDLAVITFSIVGKNKYWCDTWWHFDKGKWERLAPYEGSQLL